MCSGSNNKLSSSSFVMEGGFDKHNGFFCDCSVLLELSAMDDLKAFTSEVEEKGFDVNEASFWYCRRIGSKKMAFEERTPLMIAALFGSVKVLNYLIETGKVDVNRVCGSDKVTALHCAVAGGTSSSLGIVKLLLDASADTDLVNANGNRPVDLIGHLLKPPSNSNWKAMELLLKGDISVGEGEQTATQEEEQQKIAMPQLSKEATEKKEYHTDVSLPDINNGIYGTDEFRMYTFKVKPCSRAYSHDWTDCPFVHPGENARRRDPRKYPYSCVPCPEFRKGTCQKGDTCEYAHGVFESWLHPAQYRTRICKDEIGCMRKVCFFAHKPDELRPVYASTGSAMPSPKSHMTGALDMTMMSPLALSSSSVAMTTTSTPPMSLLAVASSPKSGSLWQNKINLTPPALQLPGSRLKTALSARDLDLEMELLGLESHANQQQQQQQLIDEITCLSTPSPSPSPSPSCWNKEFSQFGDLKTTNLDDIFGSLDSSMLSQLSLKPTTPTQLQSANGLKMRQNMSQLRSSYPTSLSSSPVRKSPSFGFDSSAAVAAAVMNSRSAAFANRSQSFIDRGAGIQRPGLTAAGNSAALMPSTRSDWSSPDGKLDWGINGDELNKFKKSASFRFRDNNVATPTTLIPFGVNEPDVSRVNSLVKDVSHESSGLFATKKQQYNHGNAGNEILPPWVEQLYMEHEQMVA